MAWLEKDTPTPLDQQPLAGLLFLDGDLIARTQEPDLARDWAHQFQGLKYPVISFPSGTEASVITDGDDAILVVIQRQMPLPYFATRDQAYARASALLEAHQRVERVGETGLVLQLDDPHGDVLLTYDNQVGHLIDLAMGKRPDQETEQLLTLKEDILAHFGQLPPEQQATLGLVLVKTILDSTWGAWFREALTVRLGMGETTHVAPYLFQVSRAQLRQAQVAEEALARLSDTDLTTIASLIYEHYLTDAFWDELAFITDLVLAGKQRTS